MSLSKKTKAELIALVESLQATVKALLEKEHALPRKAELIPSRIVPKTRSFDIIVKEFDTVKINAICNGLKKYKALMFTLKGQAGRTDSINVFIKPGAKDCNLIADFCVNILKVKQSDVVFRTTA